MCCLSKYRFKTIKYVLKKTYVNNHLKVITLGFNEILIAKRKIEPSQRKTRHRVLFCNYCDIRKNNNKIS